MIFALKKPLSADSAYCAISIVGRIYGTTSLRKIQKFWKEEKIFKKLESTGISSTTASFVGQVATGALLVGVAGTTVPVAGAVAFGVGCASGITAGALSEWGVDHALRVQEQADQDEEEVEEEQDKNTDK